MWIYPCTGFCTFVLVVYIYMGLCQLLISFIFCDSSFLHLWYVRKLSLVILSYHEFRLYLGLTLITIISERTDTCEEKKKSKVDSPFLLFLFFQIFSYWHCWKFDEIKWFQCSRDMLDVWPHVLKIIPFTISWVML